MREQIQRQLSLIEKLEVGPEEQDDILVEGINYFSFTYDEIFLSRDFDNNDVKRADFLGYVKRKVIPTENTLDIADKIADKICEQLKKLNFKCSTYDVSNTSFNNIAKIKISGNATVCESNKKLF